MFFLLHILFLPFVLSGCLIPQIEAHPCMVQKIHSIQPLHKVLKTLTAMQKIRTISYLSIYASKIIVINIVNFLRTVNMGKL